MGEIQALGPGTTAPAIGTRVLLRGGHASHLVVGADIVYPVPEGIDERAACWFGMAKIAFMGARKAEYRLGDDVLVIGAGPIGQMTVRWAAAAGARRISVVDPSAARLPLALAGGATATFATGIAAALPALTAHHGGQLPRVVIDTTGNPNVLSDALRAVRSHGRVVLLGDSGPLGDGHTMTNDLLVRGVQLVGAHDIHDDAEWNDRTVTGLFLELVARGRFPLDGLATDTFAPADCAAAYMAADARRGETMGIYFDWRGDVR
jgi:threonine dehydrogenase-like Zn-dependent dehydrogenase